MDPHNWHIAWNKGLSLDLPEVDADHIRFISLAQGLTDTIARGMELPAIKKQLQLVADDAEFHFENEAAWFRRWRYPLADIHTATHDQLRRDIRAILANTTSANTRRPWIIAAYEIRDMLVEHLLTDDMKYHDYRSEED